MEGEEMTQKTNEELALESGVWAAGYNEGVDEQAPSMDQIDDLIQLAEQRLIAKLLEGVGEPAVEQFQTLDKSDWHNFTDEAHLVNTKADGRWPVRQLYTADQVAAAVLPYKQDAERYRWLRDGPLVDGEICEELYVAVDSPAWPSKWAMVGKDLDKAVDAIRGATT